MKIKLVVSAVFLLLILPGTASALPAGVPGAFCSTADGIPANCYSHVATDGVSSVVFSTGQWVLIKVSTGQRGFSSTALGCTIIAQAPMTTSVSSGCNRIPGQSTIHTMSRLHKYQWRYPFLRAQFITFTSVDGVTIADSRYRTAVFVDENFNKPECGDPFNNPYTMIVDREQVPKPDAPADYVAACFPDAPPPTDSTDSTETTETAPATTPVTGVCPVIMVGKKKARVVRIDLSCFVARRTIAQYLRTGKEAPGWVCVKVEFAGKRVGKCVKESAGRSSRRPTVTGTYRIR